VDITWLGLSCFRIRGSQAVIVTDPFPPGLGYTLGKQTADIVTVSHPHPSHSYDKGINGEHRLVKGPGEYEISGVLIHGVNVLHLGDLGHVLSDEQVEEIGNVDVLLLPVGGVTTINAAMAAEVIRKLEPKVVIPMHYKTPKTDRDLEPVENFLKEMGHTQVEPRPKLNVSRSNLPITTEVVVLTA
jgi:L-ascorbate metabolism protein UlaG (beta-lactamase superfamily)